MALRRNFWHFRCCQRAKADPQRRRGEEEADPFKGRGGRSTGVGGKRPLWPEGTVFTSEAFVFDKDKRPLPISPSIASSQVEYRCSRWMGEKRWTEKGVVDNGDACIDLDKQLKITICSFFVSAGAGT